MKIKIIENQTFQRNVMKNGNIVGTEDVTMPTGRSWEFDVEAVGLGDLWRGMKGDIRELIMLAKNALR